MYQTDNTVVVHSNTTLIGRLYSMSPKIGNLYYLRLLLVHQQVSTSFSHLKTVDGELLSTFKEACRRHSLLDNDDHIIDAMNEIKRQVRHCLL